MSYLDETDVGALLAEALTADVQAVLADQTSRVGADAAESTMLANHGQFRRAAPDRDMHMHTRALQGGPARCAYIRDVPLAGALAVGPGTRIPNRLVRHDVWLWVGVER